METKQKIKKKTSKHVVGRNYVTLTEDDVYLGDFYQWYEPIYENAQQRNWMYGNREVFAGYKKLEKPIVQKLFYPTKEYTSTKEYCKLLKNKGLYGWHFRDKLPARTEGDIELELNALNEDWEDVLSTTRNKASTQTYFYGFDQALTLSTNPKEAFNFPDELIKNLAKHNIRVEE